MLKSRLKSGLLSIYKRITLVFVAFAMLFSFSFSIAQAPTAQAAGSTFGPSISTCAIATVGWVICPVMSTIARLADYGFAFINENFLKIEYELTSGESGIFKAWELIRNIANILFVLAFLYIVYAQITGRNTGDYNLKRILPKLVIGAILVNVSNYICAAGIQLSNIIGGAVLSLMVGVAEQIGTPAMSLDNAANGFKDGTLTNLVTTMLSKDAVVWVLMAPMAAVTIAIATISAAGIVLLIARKVVVSMLVLVSPLLFVAYLLPNLERYYQQWVRLFVQLLLLYPVVAFLLGTGQIVSATIISVGSGGESDYSVKDDDYQARNGGSGSASTDLAAAGAAVLPLIGVWWMMKGASALMSTAGSRLTAGIGRSGKARERAEKMQAKFGKPPAPTNANSINITGGRVNVFDRKPAFTRSGRHRRATPGGSALPATDTQATSRPGAANQSPLGDALNNMLNQPKQDEAAKASQAAMEATAKLEELNNANVTADQATAPMVQAMAEAADDKKKSNANDKFKSLNERNKPQSQDSQRSFGTAQAPAGSGGGGGGPSGPSVSNHANDYRAPQIAQTLVAPQQTKVTQRIVVPQQQVDASALLNNPAAPRGVAPLPGTGTTMLQDKAKGVAQKYLFDSARDVDEAAKKLEELTKKSQDAERDLSKDK